MRELRLTVRSLLRTPLYSITAVVSLALGIGATTAIFTPAAAVPGLIAVAAASVPVRRATGVDSMIALRYE